MISLLAHSWPGLNLWNRILSTWYILYHMSFRVKIISCWVLSMLLKSQSLTTSRRPFTTESFALKQSDKQLTIPICRLYNSIGQLTLKFNLEASDDKSLFNSIALNPLIIEDDKKLAISQRVSPITKEKDFHLWGFHRWWIILEVGQE